MIRRACATLGLLALFLQGSSGGHMILVEHTKCAEHGELVHGAHGHVVDVTTDDGRSLRSASSPEGGATHGHCSLAAERRDVAKLIVDAWVTRSLTIDIPDLFEIDVALRDDASRFQIAPKNSPPA